jgi:hypothetical protein
MLRLLDKLLRDILVKAAIGLATGQVRFDPPAKGWTSLTPAGQIALNIYLVDLRENRKLRSNERMRDIANGLVVEEPAPARLDCHYLISAWDSSTATPGDEPSLKEHELLYAVATVFFQEGSLNPSRTYPSNPPTSNPNHWPGRFFDIDLPIAVASAEGFPKLAEFWGTMGQDYRWKPVLYLVVTVPVALVREVAGPMVTTRIIEYRQAGRPETAEVWIQIGGHVLDATVNPPVPVAGAWVRLETAAGEPLQTTESDQLGRFTFGDLRAGRYKLRTRVVRLGELELPIDVPSLTGEYDLRFT